MDHEQLAERLQELQIQLPIGTLRRWAAEGLIEGPKRGSRPSRRGRFGDWPEKSLEDAVATWMVRHTDPVSGPPSKKYLLNIKKVAEELQVAPWKHCRIGIRELPEMPPIEEIDVATEPASNVLEEAGYTPYVTSDIMWRDDCISFRPHELVAKWLAGVEKVRRGEPLRDSFYFVYDWIIDGPRNNKGEFYDASQFSYTFNQLQFEPYSEFRRKDEQWAPGQYWSVRDRVYIFFRVPEFKEDPLNVVRKQFEPKFELLKSIKRGDQNE